MFHSNGSDVSPLQESLASLLCDGYTTIFPSEEAIRERIRYLVANQQNTQSTTKHMEDKLKELAKQLEEQAELHKKAITRAR